MKNIFSSIKTANLFFFCFICVCLYNSQAQDEKEIFDKKESGKASQARKASHYYEILVKEVLSKYYDDRTFLVDANVLLDELKSNKIPEEYAGIKALPGLPVLPDELRTDLPSSATFSGDEKTEYKIKYSDIEVLVDTSYTAKDIAFIKKLINMAANLNSFRGDRLIIKTGIFPIKKKESEGYVLAEQIDAGKISKTGSLPVIANADPFKPLVENLSSLIPLLIICIFVLLIVWIVARALANHGKRKSKEEESYTTILNEISELKNNLPSTEKHVDTSDTKNLELDNLRSYLLSSFIGNTRDSTKVINNWLNEDKEIGLQKAGKLIKAVDNRLVKVLTPELSAEISKELEENIKNLQDISTEESTSILQKFKIDFEMISHSLINEDEYKDLFGFLKQLNEQQIIHLVKEESEGITGMLLAQLEANLAGQILQKIDKSKRTKILASMGKIENIPLKSYKELADRISSKALEVIKMRFVASDGVKSVLDVLDNLPLNVQDEYLNSLAETDLHLAEKIRNTFITMPEVVDLPDKFLSNILRSLDQDTLALFLMAAEDNLKQKAMGLLPERLRMMITSNIEKNEDASLVEIEKAQRKLLQKIRMEIKLAGGRPE